MIHNLYKQRGETPLECIQRFVLNNLSLKNDPSNPQRMNKFTYLGRLDPLAEGVLLVGSGEDTKQEQREKFFGLDKEYEFVSLFGFATDTYDVLGRILRVEKIKDLNELDLIKMAKVYEGEREQKYPEYSSKMLSKKTSPLTPLLDAGEGKHTSSDDNSSVPLPSPAPRGEKRINGASQDSLRFFEEKSNEWTAPVRRAGGEVKKITIHKMQFHGLDSLSNKELFGRLLMDISKVKGDFRQHEILTLWKQILLPSPSQGEGLGGRRENEVSYLGRFSAHVSSGTYIRGLVNDIGKTLGVGATTLSIKRIRVEDYNIKDSLI